MTEIITIKNPYRIDKYEREKLAAHIFEQVTTNWSGSRMMFPIPHNRTVVIEGSDIMKIVKKSLVKTIGKRGINDKTK